MTIISDPHLSVTIDVRKSPGWEDGWVNYPACRTVKCYLNLYI
jgi:hypothetical protein